MGSRVTPPEQPPEAAPDGAVPAPAYPARPPTTKDTPTPMADNPTVVSTPYPFTVTGGDNDDDSFRAALISHSGASVERNQDAGFSAQRDQNISRDVNRNAEKTAQAKYDLAVQTKDAEIRAADRHNETLKELAALRAEMNADRIATLRVELSESKAAARQDRTESLLAGILAKLPV